MMCVHTIRKETSDDRMRPWRWTFWTSGSSAHNQNMVAVGALFLLLLSASSYHCRHGSRTSIDLIKRQSTPLFGVTSSSSSSRPRREDRIKSPRSARTPEIEGQIYGGVKVLTSDVRQLQWEEKYILLKRFTEREGHCNVAQSHKEEGSNLGRWVANQRQAKKTGTLDSERHKLMEEIDIEWVVCGKRTKVPWEELFSLLKQFKTREGHCNVPQSHTEDGAKLGAWLRRQRQLKTSKKLDPERDKRLKEIGFKRGTSTTWDEMYALLKHFKKREGHCNVPCSHTEDEANLGTWASRQRQLIRKGKMDPNRGTRLEEIGFERATSATWDEMYALLKQFIKREGHCNVPQSHTSDGANLGTWVSHQRQLKRKEKIDSNRETRLEEIGFEWAISATWDELYALLKQFKKREGHYNIPRSHTEDGANLGTWMHDQRQSKRKEKLDPDRQKRLEEIGFEWVLPSAAWDKVFAVFKRFMKREGHCNVPSSHKEDGINLGTWVSTQRHLEKSGKLDPDRQKLLDDFGFKWARQAKAT